MTVIFSTNGKKCGSSRISVERAGYALDVIPSVARNLFGPPQESRFLGPRPRNDKGALFTLICVEPEVKDPDLFPRQPNPELVDTIVKEISVRPWKSGSPLLQCFDLSKDFCLASFLVPGVDENLYRALTFS